MRFIYVNYVNASRINFYHAIRYNVVYIYQEARFDKFT